MVRKKRYYGAIRIIGAILVVVPWLGFPTSWKQIIVTILGGGIFFLAHFSRTRPPQERSLFAADSRGVGDYNKGRES
jgi:hypothetical protein